MYILREGNNVIKGVKEIGRRRRKIGEETEGGGYEECEGVNDGGEGGEK